MKEIFDKSIKKMFVYAPSILGIIIFTFVVKMSENPKVVDRLYIYQGILSWYSLLILSITYIKERSSVISVRYVPFYCVFIILPVFYYKNYEYVILLSSLVFFFNAIPFLFLIHNARRNNIISQSIASIVLPLSLLFDVSLLLAACLVGLFLLISILLKTARKPDEKLTIANGLRKIAISLSLQLPLLIFPMFDSRIICIIGKEQYANYVVISKYIYGFFVFAFTRIQYELAISGQLDNYKKYYYQLVVALIIEIPITLIEAQYAWIVAVVVYSYGNNLSSLLIRRKIIDGIPKLYFLIGLFSTAIYLILVTCFPTLLIMHNKIFLLYMLVLCSFPILFNRLINFGKKNWKKVYIGT